MHGFLAFDFSLALERDVGIFWQENTYGKMGRSGGPRYGSCPHSELRRCICDIIKFRDAAKAAWIWSSGWGM